MTELYNGFIFLDCINKLYYGIILQNHGQIYAGRKMTLYCMKWTPGSPGEPRGPRQTTKTTISTNLKIGSSRLLHPNPFVARHLAGDSQGLFCHVYYENRSPFGCPNTAPNTCMNITACNLCMNITASNIRMNMTAPSICMNVTASNI